MGKGLFMNVSAAGHVIPTFGLIAELIERGEEIHYYEVPRFQNEIENFGAIFHAYPDIQAPPGPFADEDYHNEFNLALVTAWCAKEWVPKLLEPVRDLNPDYIIHDSLCLWGRIVAQVLGIPAINSICTAAFNEASTYGTQEVRDEFDAIFDKNKHVIENFHRISMDLSEEYKIPEIKFIDTFTNPQDVNICYLSKELQPHEDKFDDSYHFVGPCAPIRAFDHDFPMEKLQDKDLILISFGTTHDPGVEFYRKCIEAFRDTEFQVIIILSNSVQESELGEIPTNFIIRKNGTVPQLDVLKKASLFIMHGGGGGARESMWSETPVIAIPQTFEQQLISQKLVKQGAGIYLKFEEVTSTTLKKNAFKILNNPSYNQNSIRVNKASRKVGGAEEAVDIILNFIKNGRSESLFKT